MRAEKWVDNKFPWIIIFLEIMFVMRAHEVLHSWKQIVYLTISIIY